MVAQRRNANLGIIRDFIRLSDTTTAELALSCYNTDLLRCGQLGGCTVARAYASSHVPDSVKFDQKTRQGNMALDGDTYG